MLRLLLALLLIAPAAVAQDAPEAPRNVVLFIGDGLGPSAVTMARDFSGRPLALDGILTGSASTAATSARVTDSAAGATALASGIKTYNGAIGVDTLERPVGTLLEAAEARGMATGLVATSRITHATPAAFAAHVPRRAMEAEIAAQMLDAGVEVVLGGGRMWFLPEAAGGARPDGRDLLAELQARGVVVATDPADFDAIAATPVLALFAPNHLDYEVDRTDQPSLAEMTMKALDLLDDAEHGFFLMVEGSRIDHAAHSNDPAGTVHDVLAFDAAVRAALDFAEADGRTLVVATADHETGGLSLGRDGVYDWDPASLARVSASAERMSELIADGTDPEAVLREHAAVDSLTADERVELGLQDELDVRRIANRTLGHLVSRRALVGWTTGGHTAVDVGLWAAGPGAERFAGALANDAVGRAIADLLGLDLEEATARLRGSEAP